MKKSLLAIAFGALAMMIAPQAQGAISYSLTSDQCTGTCGTSPFGTILLEDLTSTSVKVTVTLKAGEVFVATGAGDSIGFNLSGTAITPATDITGITSGFSVAGGFSNGGLGSFTYSVDCTVCSGGNPGNPAGPLVFTVNRASGITGLSFISNAKSFFFASDIRGTNGNTGLVGANGQTPFDPTPEPMTLSLVGGGLLMIGLRKAKNRRSA